MVLVGLQVQYWVLLGAEAALVAVVGALVKMLLPVVKAVMAQYLFGLGNHDRRSHP